MRFGAVMHSSSSSSSVFPAISLGFTGVDEIWVSYMYSSSSSSSVFPTVFLGSISVGEILGNGVFFFFFFFCVPSYISGVNQCG